MKALFKLAIPAVSWSPLKSSAYGTKCFHLRATLASKGLCDEAALEFACSKCQSFRKLQKGRTFESPLSVKTCGNASLCFHFRSLKGRGTMLVCYLS